MIPVSGFEGRVVAVLGLGRSGLSAARALRAGEASIKESYAEVRDGQVWLVNANIPEYSHGNRLNHEPRRPRKLLLHERELATLIGATEQKGFTVVPLAMYWQRGKAKLEIGAYTTLGILLEAFIGAAHELHTKGRSSFKHQRVLALIGENTPTKDWDLYRSYRRMLDFIGGMTDHFAVDLAQEMGGRLRGD